MENEQPITLVQAQIIMEEQKKIRSDIRDMSNQIDADRRDLNQVRENVGLIFEKLKTVDDNIELLREEVKEIKKLKETLPDVVKKAIDDSLTTISLTNPRKAFERQVGFVESLKRLLNKFKTR